MSADRPLEGIRVLDFTSVLLGPYCTRLLSQYGADVVKIEPPTGDVGRRVGLGKSPNMASTHLQVNRGKRSVVLDLKKRDVEEVLDQAFRWADVVVLNTRKASAARLGIGYEDARRVNPRIVYCAAIGYGSGGPYEAFGAYDDVIQAGAGLAALQSQIAQAPVYMGGAPADKVVGLVACSAILAALCRRDEGGVMGGEIEVPMLETMVEYLLLENLGGWSYLPHIGPPLFARTASPDRRPFRTADGMISVVVYSDASWAALLEFAGRGHLVGEPRLSSIGERTQNTSFAYGLLAEIFAERSTSEWLSRLREMDIAAMPLNTVEDLFEDPHLRAVEMFGDGTHPTEGPIRVVRPAVKFGGDARPPERHAPSLGEHTEEFLVECGLSSVQISALAAKGVVGGIHGTEFDDAAGEEQA